MDAEMCPDARDSLKWSLPSHDARCRPQSAAERFIMAQHSDTVGTRKDASDETINDSYNRDLPTCVKEDYWMSKSLPRVLCLLRCANVASLA